MNCTDQIRLSKQHLTDEAAELAFAGIVALVATPRAWNDDEDPNAPWLPKIPGPRTVPVPPPVKIPAPSPSSTARPAAEGKTVSIPGQRIPAKVPEQPIRQEAAPVCCGRPMRRDGDQLVCRRCGGWTTAAVTCNSCEGRGGKEIDTSSGGVTRKTWRTCTVCRGAGQR
ncbi:hypothetical protein [Streptomyces bacillaris]|uniref:hypothetical protein n=1 Tax=Streptomyces bacillaris TaxID=68179 RepID=UPI003634773F